MSQEKNKIAIIGSGRLASALAKSFHQLGFVLGIISSNPKTGSALAISVQTDYYAELPNDLNPDLIFLCVPDHAIETVSKKLPVNPETIVIHCSGATPINVLNTHSNHGVFYPLQSFSKNDAIKFNEIPIFIEANNENTIVKIHKLATSLSKTVREVESNDRLKYHLAAVFANNFTNHLVAVMQDYCDKEYLEQSLLNPILKSTFEKFTHSPAKESQTGPALRNDIATLEKHYILLKENPKLLELYKALSESIVGFND